MQLSRKEPIVKLLYVTPEKVRRFSFTDGPVLSCFL